MSIYDKCPDDGSCDNCVSVHTLTGLVGQNALENYCKWAFDHPVNEGAVFIHPFNIPHTKITFPHMFNVFDNYNNVGTLPALRYSDPDGMK